MIQKKIKNIFDFVKGFLIKEQNYDLGNLQMIVKHVMEGQLDDYKIIIEELETLVQTVYEELRTKSDKNDKQNKSKMSTDNIPYKADFVLFTLLESLIFNLYSKHKNVERTKLNSSIYSQGSVWSNKNTSKGGMAESFTLQTPSSMSTFQDISKFTEFMTLLIKRKSFFVYIANLLEENENQEKRKFFSIFLQTIHLIITKENMSKEDFKDCQDPMSRYIVAIPQILDKNNIKEVNQVIFNTKLKKIAKILSFKTSSREIHFSLIRIYIACYSRKVKNTNSKLLANINWSGKDMIHNLFKLYIQTSEAPIDGLFKEDQSTNPIFSFIINYMLLLFLPVFHDFQDLLDETLAEKCEFKTPDEFFSIMEKPLAEKIIMFFRNLPPDFTNYFCELHELIKKYKPQGSPEALPTSSSLKALLLHRFLLSPNLKILLDPNLPNNQVYLRAVNYFKDLFYPGSAKKYPNVPQFQYLSNLYVRAFDAMTTNFVSSATEFCNYYITDPLLASDYEIVYAALQRTTFEPSDEDEFELEKYKHPSMIRQNPSNQADNQISTKKPMNQSSGKSNLVSDDFPANKQTHNIQGIGNQPNYYQGQGTNQQDFYYTFGKFGENTKANSVVTKSDSFNTFSDSKQVPAGGYNYFKEMSKKGHQHHQPGYETGSQINKYDYNMNNEETVPNYDQNRRAIEKNNVAQADEEEDNQEEQDEMEMMDYENKQEQDHNQREEEVYVESEEFIEYFKKEIEARDERIMVCEKRVWELEEELKEKDQKIQSLIKEHELHGRRMQVDQKKIIMNLEKKILFLEKKNQELYETLSNLPPTVKLNRTNDHEAYPDGYTSTRAKQRIQKEKDYSEEKNAEKNFFSLSYEIREELEKIKKRDRENQLKRNFMYSSDKV